MLHLPVFVLSTFLCFHLMSFYTKLYLVVCAVSLTEGYCKCLTCFLCPACIVSVLLLCLLVFDVMMMLMMTMTDECEGAFV